MFFLQPGILWGLLAVSVPIIIHLLNRRRHRTVKWAAMQFLLKATRESRGKKRLRHILILATRALAIAALVTAAALPVINQFIGLGGGKPDLVVLVLDRSASMEAKPEGGGIPRRGIALQRVRDSLADLPGTRVVLIDSASGEPQDVPSPETLGELSSTAATDTAADLPELLRATTEFLAETSGRAEVWIASDLQHSNWLPDDDRWAAVRATFAGLPREPTLRVLSLGGRSAANQSIRIESARRAGDELILELELRRNGDARTPLELPLTTHLNGASSTESLSLAGQEMRLVKTLPLGDEDDNGFGWLSLPGDGNPRDNVAFFAYGPARPISSLVVGPSGEAADYLALAAAPDGFAGQSSSTVVPDAFASGGAPLTETAAVFWSAPLPAGPAAEELRRFLEDGGRAVFFAPESDGDKAFLGIEWGPAEDARRDEYFILDSWDRADGPLRDGIDGAPVPAERLRAIKRRTIDGEAAVLARWDDTEPFLARQVVGRGAAWFVGSRPDYRWSNLADGDVLLPLAQRTVIAGAGRFDSGHLEHVGAPPPSLAGRTPDRIDTYEAVREAEPRHLAGVYRTDDRRIAFNRPPEEDLAGAVEAERLDPLFEGLRFSLFEDTDNTARENVSRAIWPAFLIAMLFFLISEALLCLPRKNREAYPSSPSPRNPAPTV